MIDMHVHTWRCRHGSGTVEEICAAAAERGIRYLGFAEHLPLPEALLAVDPHAASYAMPADEIDEYVAEVEAARALSESESGLRVLLGIEADLHPGNEDHVHGLLSRYEFDFVLGSIHYLDGWAFDDPDRIDGYDRWTSDDLWARYFADLAAAAAASVADVLAHPDLIKKFGCRPAGDPREIYAAFAEAAAAAGVAVEVSTAGLRKPCAELYPSDALLQQLHAHGVPVTIGSDAHSPAEVGYAYDAAVDALLRAGYRSAVVFVERQMQEVPL